MLTLVQDPDDAIIVQTARDRLWEIMDRMMTPRDVMEILAGGIDGYSERWEALYKSMFDSWPRLQKNVAELQRACRAAPWKTIEYAEMDEKPSDRAKEFARSAWRMLWSTQPDVLAAEKGLNGLMDGLVVQYFTGLGVHEIDWHWQKGEQRPRAYREIPGRYYGYPYLSDGPDRLMLRPQGSQSSEVCDFPPRKFIVGMRGGHPGHPTMSAPLRVLTAYWLASVYGWKWFMQFTQLFGIPFRWATYTGKDADTKTEVKRMMESIGSAGWGVGPEGTVINTMESAKAGNALPQAELVKMADEQCDIYILGQTLTSSVGANGGNRALGEVHDGVRHDVIKGVCDFVGEAITTQLIPAWAFWNYGYIPDELPEFYPKWPEVKDEKAMAERDQILGITTGVTPVTKAYYYERHGIPMPQPEDELFQPGANGVRGDPATGEGALPHETKARLEASDWSGFAAHRGGLGIPRAAMPQIKSTNRASMVQYLRARGIESRAETVLPATLKATQAEFSPDKVQAARDHEGGNRAILVSQDDHVVDGHHQWLAALHDNPGTPIRIIRLMAPIRYVLEKIKAMPSTTTEPGKPAGTGSLADMLKTIQQADPEEIGRKLEDAMKT